MTRQNSKPTRKGSGGSQRRDVGKDAEDVSKIATLIRPPDVKEEIKGQIKQWYAQAQAAVFVGAIQAQLLKTDVVSRLELATNILFLTGIILNVTGAYIALMAASSLETDLNHLQSILDALAETPALTDEIFNALTPLAQRFVKPTHPNRFLMHRPQGEMVIALQYVTLEERCRDVKRHRGAGHLGSFAITLGFVACPAALGCLAYDEERVAMRIAASSVIGVLLCAIFMVSLMYRKIDR